MKLSRPLSPLAVSWPRALLEGIAGFLVLDSLSLLLATPGHAFGGLARILMLLLAWLWAVLVPAWRLQPAGGAGLNRVMRGVLRAVVLGAALGALALTLDGVLRHPGFDLLTQWWRAPVAGVLTAVALVFVRIGVLLLAAVQRWIALRLRRQLLVSHMLVVLAALVTMTGAGSVIGTQLILLGIRPDAVTMARGIADDLQLAGGASSAQRVFAAIEDGRLPLRGEPPLSPFARSPLLPTRLLLVRADGHIVAGYRQGLSPLPVTKTNWAAIYGQPDDLAFLRRQALAGMSASVTLSRRGGGVDQADVLAEAPVLDRRGRTIALVAVQVPRTDPTPRQYFQGTIAVFGVATVVLAVLSALPVLGISFLFAFLVARGLTGRLEVLSRVTTAIAAGDLAGRAPTRDRNEVGRLAQDVNRMAAALQRSMAELDGARRRAEDALRARQELVAAISHELRTPLAVMRAQLEIAAAEGEALPAATADTLRHETERLAALVDDLFALARADAGAIEVRAEPVDVGAVIDDVAAGMRPLAWREGEILLSADVEPGLLPARADPDRLHQIVANLVRNAVRYTPEGGIIALRARAEDGWVLVSVADTGTGIAPEHLAHLFDRFYRVDADRGRDSGGAGLGLALVKEFVERMGGEVEVQSVLDEGSVFTVRLPLYQESAAGSPVSDDVAVDPAAALSVSPPPE